MFTSPSSSGRFPVSSLSHNCAFLSLCSVTAGGTGLLFWCSSFAMSFALLLARQTRCLRWVHRCACRSRPFSVLIPSSLTANADYLPLPNALWMQTYSFVVIWTMLLLLAYAVGGTLIVRNVSDSPRHVVEQLGLLMSFAVRDFVLAFYAHPFFWRSYVSPLLPRLHCSPATALACPSASSSAPRA